jgi:hypothetical protein
MDYVHVSRSHCQGAQIAVMMTAEAPAPQARDGPVPTCQGEAGEL